MLFPSEYLAIYRLPVSLVWKTRRPEGSVDWVNSGQATAFSLPNQRAFLRKRFDCAYDKGSSVAVMKLEDKYLKISVVQD